MKVLHLPVELRMPWIVILFVKCSPASPRARLRLQHSRLPLKEKVPIIPFLVLPTLTITFALTGRCLWKKPKLLSPEEVLLALNLLSPLLRGRTTPLVYLPYPAPWNLLTLVLAALPMARECPRLRLLPISPIPLESPCFLPPRQALVLRTLCRNPNLPLSPTTLFTSP